MKAVLFIRPAYASAMIYSRIWLLYRFKLRAGTDMSTSEKVIIKGLTQDGGKFRPSDWAERLCGAVASYGPGRRIIFHPHVRLASIDSVKCVVIDAILEQKDEMLFEFLTDFAKENNLQVYRTNAFPLQEDQ
ncbi:DUF3579 domain-containing protein [Methylophaga sp. OBS4]|uniref:DUF3579 domain-containing protein n=1 Tax=Methylophaga sp. OBS4 TaxID=2991935 RepID=UPI002252BBCD|nr:DUF3579 domain-containing protein [Methylophaga sp. OBS4]MCX4187554.1 DUF3579 domain-containing protein [Methylophaga sp. OBS4]